MTLYRVLWIDAAGMGRFTTVDASSSEAAAWQVAIDAESTEAVFEEISQIGEGK